MPASEGDWVVYEGSQLARSHLPLKPSQLTEFGSVQYPFVEENDARTQCDPYYHVECRMDLRNSLLLLLHLLNLWIHCGQDGRCGYFRPLPDNFIREALLFRDFLIVAHVDSVELSLEE